MFNLIYLLTGLSYLAVAVISFFVFFLWLKKKGICKLGKIIGINGIFYLIPSFLNFLWFFGTLFPTKDDFVLIIGCFNVISATILLVIVYELVNNKGLLYFLFLFLLTAVAIPFSTSAFFLLISLASYLLILIIFLDLALFSNVYLKRAGYLGISYSILSIILLGSGVFLNQKPFLTFWFIPPVIMFMIIWLFYKDIEHCGSKIKGSKPKIKKAILPLLFIKFVVFIISISSFIFLSTIAIHELGHTLAAQYYGCERGKAIIYDITDSPHADMVCEGYYNDTIITLAGIILTVVVGVIFFLTGGQFTNTMSFLIFGFSLLMGYGDLNELGISMNIITVVILISLILVITGIIKLSTYYIKQQKGFYERRKEIEAIDTEKYFWLDEKRSIKDLYELVEAIHNMDNPTFKQYVNEDKNDFSKWIRDVIKDENLANDLLKTTDKKETLALVLMKLLKEQAESDRTILKFICYPLLKDKTNLVQK